MRGRRRTCDADARALLRAVADRLSGKRLPSAHGTAQAKAPSLLRLRRGSRDTCCGVARYQAAWWGGRAREAGGRAGGMLHPPAMRSIDERRIGFGVFMGFLVEVAAPLNNKKRSLTLC